MFIRSRRTRSRTSVGLKCPWICARGFLLQVEEITFLRKSASIISECCKIVFGGERVEITLPMFQSWQIQNYKKVDFQSESEQDFNLDG